MPSSDQKDPSSELRHVDVRDTVSRFRDAWEAGQTPDIEDYLSDEPVRRERELAKLIPADIEYRLRGGEAARVEQYFERFPKIAEDHFLVRRLIAAEYQFRQQESPRPEVGEYLERFPEDRDKIREILGTVPASDGESTSTLTLQPDGTVFLGGVYEIQEDALPIQFGRFELRAIVGQGGFGTVYRAYDTHLDREVAVKIPRLGALETQDQVNRFLREARSGGKLNHPNICAIHDAGEWQGRHYLVMGFIDGTPLSRFITPEKPVEPKIAVRIVLKLTAALAEAHDLGIVHRDLKPSNIMIDEKRREPIILDFGLARSFLKDSFQTQSGQVLGTPTYMSPEQCRGAASEIGPKSDIYSLGVILYELLVSHPPFSGSTAEVFAQILTRDVIAPSKLKPDLDPTLEAICLKAMAKDPKQRFESMVAFGKALKAYLQNLQGSAADGAASKSGVQLNASQIARLAASVTTKKKVDRPTPKSTKIEFACPHCRLPVRSPNSTAGKKGKCPNCGAVVQIPKHSTAPVSPGTSARSLSPVVQTKPAEPASRVEFPCPRCHTPVRLPAGASGKKGKCPTCGAIFDLPKKDS